MGTYIVLRNTIYTEYAIFDYRPGAYTSFFYEFRDRHIVMSAADLHKTKSLGRQITSTEYMEKYGIPQCIEGIYKNDWIPF